MSWYGIKGVFSQLVKGTLPMVDCKPVPFDVWLSPSLPAWDHEPTVEHGPYRMIRTDVEAGRDGAVYAYVESPHFLGVLNEFATLNMPREGEICLILDEHPQIIIGWTHGTGGYEWLGCQRAFSLLALHHPINAAIWEVQAAEKRNIDLREWSL